MEKKPGSGKPSHVVNKFLYQLSGRAVRFHPSKPQNPRLTSLVRTNRTADAAMPAAGGILQIAPRRGRRRIIQDPSSVSTPNTTRFWGISHTVAAVISAPPAKTVRPRRSFRPAALRQKLRQQEETVARLKEGESELKALREWKKSTVSTLKKLQARVEKEITRAQEKRNALP